MIEKAGFELLDQGKERCEQQLSPTVQLHKSLPFGFVSSCETATTSTILIFLLAPDPLPAHLHLTEGCHRAPLPPPSQDHCALLLMGELSHMQLNSLGKRTKILGPDSEIGNFSWWPLDLSDKATTQNNEVEDQCP